MTPTELLASVPLFADLTLAEIEKLAAASAIEDLRRGDVLFRENDESDRLYVVMDGRIAIAKRSIDGRESVVALMEGGDLFGEMPLFDRIGRSAEARALEVSRVLVIAYGPVREVYEQRPELLWGVVELLAGRLRNMDVALADTVFLDVTGRTAKRLVEMAGDDDEFNLPVTQEELAVGKREVSQGGVRIYSRVLDTREMLTLSLGAQPGTSSGTHTASAITTSAPGYTQSGSPIATIAAFASTATNTPLCAMIFSRRAISSARHGRCRRARAGRRCRGPGR